MGHDRWIADLRPMVEPILRKRGLSLGLCCHPYDLCTELIAREAGVVVTDERGQHLAAPLDVTSDCSWIGYANAAIQQQVEPVLRSTLEERGLWSDGGATRCGRLTRLHRQPCRMSTQFVALLNEHAAFFEPDTPITLARAPGRLDLMGGIADYSGSLGAATAAWRRHLSGGTAHRRARGIYPFDRGVHGNDNAARSKSRSRRCFRRAARFPTSRRVRCFASDPARAWAAYVAGVLIVLRPGARPDVRPWACGCSSIPKSLQGRA